MCRRAGPRCAMTAPIRRARWRRRAQRGSGAVRRRAGSIVRRRSHRAGDAPWVIRRVRRPARCAGDLQRQPRFVPDELDGVRVALGEGDHHGDDPPRSPGRCHATALRGQVGRRRRRGADGRDRLPFEERGPRHGAQTGDRRRKPDSDQRSRESLSVRLLQRRRQGVGGGDGLELVDEQHEPAVTLLCLSRPIAVSIPRTVVGLGVRSAATVMLARATPTLSPALPPVIRPGRPARRPLIAWSKSSASRSLSAVETPAVHVVVTPPSS